MSICNWMIHPPRLKLCDNPDNFTFHKKTNSGDCCLNNCPLAFEARVKIFGTHDKERPWLKPHEIDNLAKK